MAWDDARPVKSTLLSMWEMATDAATWGMVAHLAHLARGNPGAADMDWWLGVLVWGAGVYAALALSFLVVMLALFAGLALVLVAWLAGALALDLFDIARAALRQRHAQQS